jgi:hypothetical protein
LVRWWEPNETSSSKTTEVLLLDDSLEEVVCHTTVSNYTVLVQAHLVGGVKTPDAAHSVAKVGNVRSELLEGGAVCKVKLVRAGAVVAHITTDPHPAGAGVEDEGEGLLVGADVDLGEDLDVEERLKLLVDVVGLTSSCLVERLEMVSKPRGVRGRSAGDLDGDVVVVFLGISAEESVCSGGKCQNSGHISCGSHIWLF